MGVRLFLYRGGGDNNMNNYQRPRSPFEDTAVQRLRRIGLTTEDGAPEQDAMSVFGTIFAGSSLTTCATTTRTMSRSGKWWLSACTQRSRPALRRNFS